MAIDYVTLPNFTDLTQAKILPCVATDFAIATGATVSPSGYSMVWTNTVKSKNQVCIADTTGQEHWLFAGRRMVGVAPQFRDPAKHGIGLTKVDGQSVVTINDLVVYYPRTRMDEGLSQILTFNMVTKPQTNLAGVFCSDNIPLETGITDPLVEQVPTLQMNPCYRWGKHYYVYVANAKCADQDSLFSDCTNVENGAGYWFLCEPVAATRLANGNIQCCEALFATQFHPQQLFENMLQKKQIASEQTLDPNDFCIGSLLNNFFLTDLQATREFNTREQRAAQIIDSFPKSSLLTNNFNSRLPNSYELL